MAGSHNDDETDDAYDAAFDQHRAALYDMLMDYADTHELSDSFMAVLASDIGLSLRMVAYAAETEKPSVGGLRLDLDRYARELGDSVRDAKKYAAEFIAEAKAAQEADEEEDDDEDEDGAAEGEPKAQPS
ncbi:hypothetical protein KHC23_10380 [Ancylobacter dichloromethanicus]|uniref:Uncharacterized protein n=1 Tax=Ancylobacter dichloromethanicus TaxID=518825 RepID=A0A9W6MYP9_9HYPH|nr:hypothetical protein [Ancylobacter dichloromethanicus]MBS7554057.1 hypothetical protein [Ancylobacter dichloromethanicus]GLK71172.1 hypothetical protein GCM10017643_12870 [Ancylobacter dichloromethanicus]